MTSFLQGVGTNRLRDIIAGVTPTYSGWDTDPTDGADITDGDPTTACTTGSKTLTAGWQTAYCTWNLGLECDILLTGIAAATVTAGTPYTWLQIFQNGVWRAWNSGRTEPTPSSLSSVSGRASYVRIGLTSGAACTLTPNIVEVHAWRIA